MIAGAMSAEKFGLHPYICSETLLFLHIVYSHCIGLDIIVSLNRIQLILMHVGPLLSAIMFIVAGIFYAIGQLFPSHQRANFHTTAGDMIMGAIIVAVLSVTANSFAVASSHLLLNNTLNVT